MAVGDVYFDHSIVRLEDSRLVRSDCPQAALQIRPPERWQAVQVFAEQIESGLQTPLGSLVGWG